MREYSTTILPRDRVTYEAKIGEKTVSLVKTAIRKIRVLPRRSRKPVGAGYDNHIIRF